MTLNLTRPLTGEHRESSTGAKARSAHKADLTANSEILGVSPPYRYLQPVTGRVLLEYNMHKQHSRSFSSM
jgi:hypothetical protein